MENTSSTLPQPILNNGIAIPAIGFGTYKLNNADSINRSISTAISAGYRSIDCAAYYGNESLIGQAIAKIPINRNELFISSKLWISDTGYDNTLRAFDKTLSSLRLEYVDLYLIHWPATASQTPEWESINRETWRAMERLVSEDRTRAIGVCNFKPSHLIPLIDSATILPAVNQIEFHPGCNQRDTSEFCKHYDIQIEAWSPLARGRIMQNDILTQIAHRHGVSVAQICLRWCIQNHVIPLPKSENPDRIRCNIDIFRFSLSKEEMSAIDNLDGIDNSGLDPDTVKF